MSIYPPILYPLYRPDCGLVLVELVLSVGFLRTEPVRFISPAEDPVRFMLPAPATVLGFSVYKYVYIILNTSLQKFRYSTYNRR